MTLAVAFVTIVFGELVPKTLALAHAERYALLLRAPGGAPGPDPGARRVGARRHHRAGSPARWASRDVDRDRITAEELMILVERGGEQGIIEAEEEQMIGAVLELGERKVHEVMVPRIAIVALPATATLDQIVDTIVEGGHSRIPVYEDSVDNIVGILYAKDLLPYLKGEDQPPPVGTLVRAPLFVPESMIVDDLLHSLQRRRVHIAIVLDEYGGTAGLVTIEDLLEEIVGEIQDEYDTEEPMIVPLARRRGAGRRPGGHRGPAGALRPAVDAVEDQEEYDTVGGLIYHRIGGVPKVGDEVRVGDALLAHRRDDRRPARGQGPGAAFVAGDGVRATDDD